MSENFDVIIVGGGMVGAAIACGLGHSDLRIAVIEQQAPESFDADQPHDLRVSALSLATQHILEGLGAWAGVTSKRLCPFRRMRVWETAGDTEFNSQDIGRPELGYIVENRITQLALWERMQSFDNIELLCPESITRIDYQSNGPSQVRLENGRVLQARLLIAADGGHSRVRQAASIGVTSWDYGQHALVIYVKTAYEQQDITWQRFVSTGPQAFLPLSGPYASLVWYNLPDEVKRLKALSPNELLRELINTFPDCLGNIESILGIASFPLKRQHAQQYVKPCVVLAGDAAHMINPLAGQGVNIGFLDAAALIEVLLDAVQQGQDIADIKVLQRYEVLRRKDNLRMMSVMDLFYRVFSNDKLPIRFFRNMGLGLAERVKPAKIKVMKMAMGLEGNLPKLARGQSVS